MTRRTRPAAPPGFRGAGTPATGDHRNDLPGLRAAGLGVLRANPPPPLRTPGLPRTPERFVFPKDPQRSR